MAQGNYPEDTQNLIRRAQQMGAVPTLDLTNWQSPRYISGDYQTKSLTNPITLSNACHSIEIKTTVDGVTDKCPIFVESSIVVCTTAAIASCPADAGVLCPTNGTVGTDKFINMLAVFNMGDVQASVKVTFKYVVNGVPTQTTVTGGVAQGLNHVYAFTTNQSYGADTIIVLYGAEVLT